MTNREDHSRIRKGHADVNFSTLRKTALVIAQERNNQQGRDQKQTPHRRLGRRLPLQSAFRIMTYDAIALVLNDSEADRLLGRTYREGHWGVPKEAGK